MLNSLTGIGPSILLLDKLIISRFTRLPISGGIVPATVKTLVIISQLKFYHCNGEKGWLHKTERRAPYLSVRYPLGQYTLEVSDFQEQKELDQLGHSFLGLVTPSSEDR